MNTYILPPGQKPKQIKNLRWLLRHWQGVDYLEFHLSKDRTVNDGKLIAVFKNGTLYVTNFAFISVCWSWLDRPVFRGLEFQLFLNNICRSFIVGNETWREINNLEYKEFIEYIFK